MNAYMASKRACCSTNRFQQVETIYPRGSLPHKTIKSNDWRNPPLGSVISALSGGWLVVLYRPVRLDGPVRLSNRRVGYQSSFPRSCSLAVFIHHVARGVNREDSAGMGKQKPMTLSVKTNTPSDQKIAHLAEKPNTSAIIKDFAFMNKATNETHQARDNRKEVMMQR